MSEKPLERLNYFNGQRLQAGDFKLEQEYHMRVRRWLNRSLYTPGIAMGLEVYPIPGAPRVRINPGVAIDALGREIILLESREVPVMHDIGQSKVYAGSYIVIRYREELLAQQDATCAPAGCADQAAAGGPSRVLADPVVECVPDLPHEASGKILLGRVRLAAGCGSIASIDTAVRGYVNNASTAKVRQYALEGFRDIDEGNDGLIFFHIREQSPSTVTLYLRSECFPTYHYTEIGRHQHGVTLGSGGNASTGDASPSTLPSHTHAAGSLSASATDSSNHDHSFTAWRSPLGDNLNSNVRSHGRVGFQLRLNDQLVGDDNVRSEITQQVHGEFSGGSHGHPVSGSTGSESAAVVFSHTHPISGAVGDFPSSATALPADASGDNLGFVQDLRIALDKNDPDSTTELIRQQISNANTGRDWSSIGLGQGGENDPLSAEGSGPIRLDFVGSIGQGDHTIRLSLRGRRSDGKRNGGRIYYNLYVE